jgi:hypothetical protein
VNTITDETSLHLPAFRLSIRLSNPPRIDNRQYNRYPDERFVGRGVLSSCCHTVSIVVAKPADSGLFPVTNPPVPSLTLSVAGTRDV